MPQDGTSNTTTKKPSRQDTGSSHPTRTLIKRNQVHSQKWNGPCIYDGEGELIWSGAHQFNHWNTFDFRTVQVNGQPMLSLIDPHNEHAEGVILDDSYSTYAAVNLLGNLSQSNMHDFTVADDGATALTLMNDHGPSTLEQSLVIGYNGTCRAGWEGFKEIRVSDGSILFSWRARDWIGLDECMFIPSPVEERCSRFWDILHLNSIDKFPDGDYLVSSRHMNAVYKISHIDGHVVWRLGGKKSDFKLDGPLVFSRQHHARVYSQNDTHTLISLFDNAFGSGSAAAEHPTNDHSRGLLIALRTSPSGHPIAELVAHYDHPNAALTNSRGSISFLPNTNVFMGWTYASLQSEHSANGTLLMQAKFRLPGAHSYRNYKFPWVGRPKAPPDVYSTVVKGNEEGSVYTVLYVSWNGATEVRKWKVYRVTREGGGRELVAVMEKRGFETGVSIGGYAAYLVVEAVDEDGEVLEFGTTEPLKTVVGKDFMESADVAAGLQWLQTQELAQKQANGEEDGEEIHDITARPPPTLDTSGNPPQQPYHDVRVRICLLGSHLLGDDGLSGSVADGAVLVAGTGSGVQVIGGERAR